MLCDYSITNKNSIHITFDTIGAKGFIEELKILKNNSTHKIIFDIHKTYRGKNLLGLIFLVKDEGEFVHFNNNFLVFEIEKEMVEEFILFIENAIINKGFKTPEIIDFSRKSKKDENITIYGFLENEIK